MIGGRIIQIETGPPIKLWVYSPEEGELCVHAEDDKGVGLPELGCEIWWQAGRIMFDGDRRTLRKIANSHSPEACRT